MSQTFCRLIPTPGALLPALSSALKVDELNGGRKAMLGHPLVVRCRAFRVGICSPGMHPSRRMHARCDKANVRPDLPETVMGIEVHLNTRETVFQGGETAYLRANGWALTQDLPQPDGKPIGGGKPARLRLRGRVYFRAWACCSSFALCCSPAALCVSAAGLGCAATDLRCSAGCGSWIKTGLGCSAARGGGTTAGLSCAIGGWGCTDTGAGCSTGRWG